MGTGVEMKLGDAQTEYLDLVYRIDDHCFGAFLHPIHLPAVALADVIDHKKILLTVQVCMRFGIYIFA